MIQIVLVEDGMLLCGREIDGSRWPCSLPRGLIVRKHVGKHVARAREASKRPDEGFESHETGF